MERRVFLRAGAAAGTALATGATIHATRDASRDATRDTASRQSPSQRRFQLAYAPHFGMFENHAGEDVVEQLRFMAGEGFTALEDNGMKGRPVAEQQRIATEMQRLGMRMGVFVAHTIGWNEPNLTSGDAEKRTAFLDEVRASIDVAKRVHATWMTVVPGRVDPRLDMDFQTANVVDCLRRACAILEPHGLVMVLEPLNTLRDHPGQFLTRIPQAFLICKAVNSPSCKILFDIYHQQITEGNLIPNMNAAWDEVAYLQVGDNPGRNEPGTGEINYRNVFKHLHEKRYTGIIGMEHGNAGRGREGERAVIDAYIAADAY
ncbi:MAG: hydroxypyruvate isomerase family protein [Longimicrobiales bacterium]